MLQLLRKLDDVTLTKEKGKGEVLNFAEGNNNKVWQAFYDEKMKFINEYKKYIHTPYLSGLDRLNFPRNRFPSILEIKEKLKSVGWDVIVVPGFIPGREYANHLLNRQFPLASNVRSLKHVKHAKAPDAIHDMWGHLPLLFDEDYSHFLHSIAKEISKTKVGKRELAIYNARNELGLLEESGKDSGGITAARNKLMRLEKEEFADPEHFTRMSRLFLWTVEFGLIGSKSNPKMIGAALLSSFEEGLQVVNNSARVEPLTKKAVYSEINFTEPQSQLFLAQSIQDYLSVLNECSLMEAI